MSELRRTVAIVNKRGLHARASAKLVGAVTELGDATRVRVAKDGQVAQGSSILGLMMLGAAKGDSIELIVEGDGAQAALEQLCELIGNGFGEE